MKLWEKMKAEPSLSKPTKKVIPKTIKELKYDYNVYRVNNLTKFFQEVLNTDDGLIPSMAPRNFTYTHIGQLKDVTQKDTYREYTFSFHFNCGIEEFSSPPSNKLLAYMSQELEKCLKCIEKEVSVTVKHNGSFGFEESPPPLYWGGPLDTIYEEYYEVIVKIFD